MPDAHLAYSIITNSDIFPMDVFHLQLTGEVGSSTFNARQVRNVLAQYPGKHVDVMVDSFGGSLPEGLSICGAIRDHGDVTVHFRGMCASAATIASMGAKRISIAPEAMYLVHKASMEFFDWANRNADQLEDFIKALQGAKDDLDTIDRSMAELYAGRCKRKTCDLLELMKAEKWLTAKEALDWGFVDEIQGAEPVEKPRLTKAQARACRALGHPLPPIAMELDKPSWLSAARDLLNELLGLSDGDRYAGEASVNHRTAAPGNGGEILNDSNNSNDTVIMNDKNTQNGGNGNGAASANGQANVGGSPQHGAGATANGNTGISANGQGNSNGGGAAGNASVQTGAKVSASGGASGTNASDANASEPGASADESSLMARIAELEAENARLKNSTPAAGTGSVTPDPMKAQEKRAEKGGFARFARTSASARKLFDSLP